MMYFIEVNENETKKNGIDATHTQSLRTEESGTKLIRYFFLFAVYGNNKIVTLTEIMFFIKDKNLTLFFFTPFTIKFK